jgi:hypothetical protein
MIFFRMILILDLGIENIYFKYCQLPSLSFPAIAFNQNISSQFMHYSTFVEKPDNVRQPIGDKHHVFHPTAKMSANYNTNANNIQYTLHNLFRGLKLIIAQ